MSILAVYLAPYDAEDDINLHLYSCEPSIEAISNLIAKKYDLVPDSLKIWKETNAIPDSGQFSTNDTIRDGDMDPDYRLDWWFEILPGLIAE